MENLKNKQFGRWTAKRFSHKVKKTIFWTCVCKCGTEKAVSACHLRNGASRSCGCLRKEILAITRSVHRLSENKVYQRWHNMIRRCHDPKSMSYHLYGARGIAVCPEWHNIQNFIRDMGMPKKGMSLERINNNGPYSPGNCRWAKQWEQTRNTRRNKVITYKGQSKPLVSWSEDLRIPLGRLKFRLKRNWPMEKVFSRKIFRGRGPKPLFQD